MPAQMFGLQPEGQNGSARILRKGKEGQYRSRPGEEMKTSSGGVGVTDGSRPFRQDCDPVRDSRERLSIEEMEFAAEIDELAADTLSESQLWRIAGTRNLATVETLELVVDTHRRTVEDLGLFVPCLMSLTLDGSVISSIRDLGTALKNLQVLSLNGVGLDELDGMSALPELRKLYLRDNRLSELTGLCMHENLQILDMSNNCICELEAVEILGTCNKLYSLDLRGNVFDSAQTAAAQITATRSNQRFGVESLSVFPYRAVVLSRVTTLRVLDGTQVSSTEVKEAIATMAISLEGSAAEAGMGLGADSDGCVTTDVWSRAVCFLIQHVQSLKEECHSADATEESSQNLGLQQHRFGSTTVAFDTVLDTTSSHDFLAFAAAVNGFGADTDMVNNATVGVGAGSRQTKQINDLFDASSELTLGTNQTFAGGGSALMRDRRKRKSRNKSRGNQKNAVAPSSSTAPGPTVSSGTQSPVAAATVRHGGDASTGKSNNQDSSPATELSPSANESRGGGPFHHEDIDKDVEHLSLLETLDTLAASREATSVQTATGSLLYPALSGEQPVGDDYTKKEKKRKKKKKEKIVDALEEKPRALEGSARNLQSKSTTAAKQEGRSGGFSSRTIKNSMHDDAFLSSPRSHEVADDGFADASWAAAATAGAMNAIAGEKERGTKGRSRRPGYHEQQGDDDESDAFPLLPWQEGQGSESNAKLAPFWAEPHQRQILPGDAGGDSDDLVPAPRSAVIPRIDFLNQQRRRQKHRGRGWQVVMSRDEDCEEAEGGLGNAAADMLRSASSEESDDEDNDEEDSGFVSRAALKARSRNRRVDEEDQQHGRKEGDGSSALGGPVRVADRTPVQAETRTNRCGSSVRVVSATSPDEVTPPVELKAKGGGSVACSSSSQKTMNISREAGRRLGFDLEGSLKAIQLWSDEKTPPESEEKIGHFGKKPGVGKLCYSHDGATAVGEETEEKATSPADEECEPLVPSSAHSASSSSAGKVVQARSPLRALALSPPTPIEVDGHVDERREEEETAAGSHMVHREEIFQQCKAESERKKSRDGATRSHDVCKEKVGISPRPALTTTIGSSGNDGTTDSAPGGGSLIPVDEARFVPSSTPALRSPPRSLIAEPLIASGDPWTLGIVGGGDAETETDSVGAMSRPNSCRSMVTEDSKERGDEAQRERAVPGDEKEGEACSMPDESLVEMLKQPPKHVPRLRTREGFRRYFRGVSETRMRSLLSAAYNDREPQEREKRTDKRIELLRDVLV